MNGASDGGRYCYRTQLTHPCYPCDRVLVPGAKARPFMHGRDDPLATAVGQAALSLARFCTVPESLGTLVHLR